MHLALLLAALSLQSAPTAQHTGAARVSGSLRPDQGASSVLAGGAPSELDPAGPFTALGGGEVQLGAMQPDSRIPAGPDGGAAQPFLSFAAGDYLPPEGERLDPRLVAGARAEPSDGRGAARTFAFALLSRRVGEAELTALEQAGATVLGQHPWNAVKLALPVSALDAVAYLPEVRWLGLAPAWQKLHPRLAARRAQVEHDAELELWVSVFESDLGAESVEEILAAPFEVSPGGIVIPGDGAGTRAVRVHSHGWQELALRELGVEPLEYVDSVRAFAVRTTARRLDALLEPDFVQFVELREPVRALHNDSIPISNSDFVRANFSGGTSQVVVGGLIDSGLDSAHADLAHAWGVGWELGGMGGPNSDVCEHGSHVAGTFFGTGGIDAEFRGNAPGLGGSAALRIFNIKTSNACTGWIFSLATALNLLSTSYFDGATTTPYPHVINNSWGGDPGSFVGSEVEARMIDAKVYDFGQVYVFAAGNDGPAASTLSLHSSSKNALVVGSVDPRFQSPQLPGSIAMSSSRGPTGDQRWKPNLTAPGVSIDSVDANSMNGHTVKSGTSMATPHVSGIVALLDDQHAALRYAPERVASLLMATALPKDGKVLVDETDPHLTSYGAGRVDAFRASYPTAQNPWTNWGFGLPTNTYAFGDFTIGPGCTRLVVCLNFVEPAASAGAGFAVRNDLDLFIDGPPIDPAFNTGEYTSQQSARDNTEIRVIPNPAAGNWRWKVWPSISQTYSYISVTVSASYGNTTPPLTVDVQASKVFLKPGDETTFTTTVWNGSYVAVNTVLEPSYYANGYPSLNTYQKILADGIVAGNYPSGMVDPPLVLGNIPAGGGRIAKYSMSYFQEGFWPFEANVRGENAAPAYGARWIVVDGTPPAALDSLENQDHVPGVWSTLASVSEFTWTGGGDALSGVAGYSWTLSEGAPIEPDALVEELSPNVSLYLYASSGGLWFSVRAVDLCGNAGPVATFGPILIDDELPGLPYDFSTASQQVGVLSCNPRLVGAWLADDAHSGVAGHAAVWDALPDTDPGTTITTVLPELEHVFSLTAPMEVWLHVRAIDVAGNAGPLAHFGPFPLEPYAGSTVYCTSKLSGSGCTPAISTSGAPIAAYGPADDFHITASGVDGQAAGWLVWGVSNTPTTWQPIKPLYGHAANGVALCLAAEGSIPGLDSGGSAQACDGSLDLAFDWIWFSTHGFSAGQTLYAQYVYSDPLALDGSGIGHTDAVEFTLCP